MCLSFSPFCALCLCRWSFPSLFVCPCVCFFLVPFSWCHSLSCCLFVSVCVISFLFSLCGVFEE